MEVFGRFLGDKFGNILFKVEKFLDLFGVDVSKRAVGDQVDGFDAAKLFVYLCNRELILHIE